MLAYIHEISRGSGDRPDNSLPTPPVQVGGGPIIPPPLAGIWPPPGMPNLPIDPGFGGGWPITLPLPPGNATLPELPPGIYPPLPPTSTGKYAVLVWVIGVGTRWAVVDAPQTAQPK